MAGPRTLYDFGALALARVEGRPLPIAFDTLAISRPVARGLRNLADDEAAPCAAADDEGRNFHTGEHRDASQ